MGPSGRIIRLDFVYNTVLELTTRNNYYLRIIGYLSAKSGDSKCERSHLFHFFVGEFF